MKIGIMTMQRIKNYGSFLQAYGLKKNFEKLGCEVSFVDYHFEKTLVDKKQPFLKKIIQNINVVGYLRKKRVQLEYDKAFEKKFIPELCGKKYNYLPKDIDNLVIGSDEVFNCLQTYPVGYSRELFGMNYDYCDVYSYAASFGQTNYKMLKKHGIADEIASLLGKFKEISVRDDNSYRVVEALTKREPLLNLDPVLVSDYSDEMVDNVKLKDYIILYAYPGRLSKKEEKAIKDFAKRHHKTIVGFGMYQRICDINIVVHPFEILSYFEHADFVITDTFHGSIFAIKTHTNFCTIIRDYDGGNSKKVGDLLLRLAQDDRIVNKVEDLESLYKDKANFMNSDKVIVAEREKSVRYFNRIVRNHA